MKSSFYYLSACALTHTHIYIWGYECMYIHECPLSLCRSLSLSLSLSLFLSLSLYIYIYIWNLFMTYFGIRLSSKTKVFLITWGSFGWLLITNNGCFWGIIFIYLHMSSYKNVSILIYIYIYVCVCVCMCVCVCVCMCVMVCKKYAKFSKNIYIFPFLSLPWIDVYG